MRAWLERGAIVAVALATIATSKLKGWYVKAPVPQLDGTHVSMLTVLASHPPEVRDGAWNLIAPSAHSGERYEYRVPGRLGVSEISLTGPCATGTNSGCSSCEPPEAAYVKVSKIVPLPTWRLDKVGDEVVTAFQLPPSGKPETVEMRYHLAYRAKRAPTIALDGNLASVSHREVAAEGGFDIALIAYVERPMEVRWRPHLYLEDTCESTAASCSAPTGELLEIASVDHAP